MEEMGKAGRITQSACRSETGAERGRNLPIAQTKRYRQSDWSLDFCLTRAGDVAKWSQREELDGSIMADSISWRGLSDRRSTTGGRIFSRPTPRFGPLDSPKEPG